MLEHQYNQTYVQKYLGLELEKNMLRYILKSDTIFDIYYLRGLSVSDALSLSSYTISSTHRHKFIARSNLTVMHAIMNRCVV